MSQEYIAIMNKYTLNIRAEKYIKKTLAELKHIAIVIVWIDSPLFAID